MEDTVRRRDDSVSCCACDRHLNRLNLQLSAFSVEMKSRMTNKTLIRDETRQKPAQITSHIIIKCDRTFFYKYLSNRKMFI